MNPDVVVIHVGLQDLWDGSSEERVFEDYQKLVEAILKHSATKLCMSLIIPVLGYPILNKRITSVNEKLSTYITEMRKRNDLKQRLFTCSNDILAGYIERSVGSQGKYLRLTGRGEKKLWLRLKDNITRSLMLPLQSTNHDRDHKRNNIRND